ncbi:MAG: hypothetical protein QOK88_00805 [Nitrososphaeraceae archaeon]|nr:hypothetical protein [Nitrososphaeraceae archaeon]
MSFSNLHSDLLYNIKYHNNEIQQALKKSPNSAYQYVNQLSEFTGSRYNVTLNLHFPDPKKIYDVENYGKENLGLVVDKFRKKFPIPRNIIKQKAMELLGNVTPQDAYMYEGKEGLKILSPQGRIEILPGSIHLWCKIDENLIKFCDWLMQQVFLINEKGSKESL